MLHTAPSRAALTAVAFVLLVATAPAQDSGPDQRPGFFLTAALVNGAFGGLGGVINRAPNQRPGRAFLRGFGVGAAGGLLQQTGMSMTNLVTRRRRLGPAWPATLVHAAGTSLVENATLGRRPLSHFHLNLYLTRLDYDIPEGKLRARLLVSGAVALAVMQRDSRLNLRRSLASGLLYHDYSRRRVPPSRDLSDYQGQAFSTAVTVDTDLLQSGDEARYFEIAAHELVHTLQFNGAVHTNALIAPWTRRWSKRAPAYRHVARYAYFDLGPAVLLGLYHTAFKGRDNPCYYDNRLERIAEHYATGARPPCW